MTANAVISVSLDPLLFLVSVHKDARINGRIKEEGSFAVNLLADDQEGLSRLFASPDRSSGRPALHSLGGGYGSVGAPLAAGALAAIDCELAEIYAGGDHDLFLGRVVEVRLGDTRKGPLIFHEGAYPTLKSASRLEETGAFVDSVRGLRRPPEPPARQKAALDDWQRPALHSQSPSFGYRGTCLRRWYREGRHDPGRRSALPGDGRNLHRIKDGYLDLLKSRTGADASPTSPTSCLEPDAATNHSGASTPSACSPRGTLPERAGAGDHQTSRPPCQKRPLPRSGLLRRTWIPVVWAPTSTPP